MTIPSDAKDKFKAALQSGRPITNSVTDDWVVIAHIEKTEYAYVLNKTLVETFLDSVKSYAMRNNFSLDYVARYFTSAARGIALEYIDLGNPQAAILLMENEIEEAYTRLIEFISASNMVLIPIDGLKIINTPIQIGPITFYENDPQSDPLKTWLASEPAEPFRKRVEESFRSADIYAVVSNLIGDHDYITAEAESNIEDILHIIRLFHITSTDARKSIRQKIGIAGRFGKNQRAIVLTQRESLKGGTGFTGEAYRTLPYNLSAADVERWNEIGLERLLSMFAGVEKGDLAKRIVRSVRWYGSSQNTNNPQEHLVALAIALESLLIGSESSSNPNDTWGSITQRLAERVAFLIGTDGETRLRYDKRVKELYGLRSKVVHQGEPVSPDDLDELDAIVAETILRLVNHQARTWDKFQNWIKRAKYS